MLRSMTGYGRAQTQWEGRDITVEIRSINHRFFDFSTRLPRVLAGIEAQMKAIVQKRVARGKVDVTLTITSPVAEPAQVQLNAQLASSYVGALREAAKTLGLQDDLKLSSLLSIPELCAVTKQQEDTEAIWAQVAPLLEEALDSFMQMREAEGEKLRQDMLQKLDSIAARVTAIEEMGPPVLEAYRERLRAQLAELLETRDVDEARILQEAAVYADRIAVDEETVRLRSHIAQFGEILRQPEPVGRKLDFLLQEFQREANTIGSKLASRETAKLIVEMKNDIEKVREQVQNIE